jgi:hypothetical protein
MYKNPISKKKVFRNEYTNGKYLFRLGRERAQQRSYRRTFRTF